MSRLSLLAWIAALAATTCSTYELWRGRLEPVETFMGVCIGSPTSGVWVPFRLTMTPLLGDASGLAGLATLWAIPSAVVVAGLLAAYADPARAAGVGRRIAGLLTLIAVATPLSPDYFDGEACEMVPVLSGPWFARVGEAWAAEQTLLLVAAALVLLATRSAGDAEPASLTGRRAAAVTIDYLIVVILALLAGNEYVILDHGVMNQVELLYQSPAAVLLLPLAVFYALPGRTFGKRIMRLDVVADGTGQWPGRRRTAVRALVFPGLVLIPGFGLVALAVDALWWLLTGHPLHDRLSGTTVKRTNDDLLRRSR